MVKVTRHSPWGTMVKYILSTPEITFHRVAYINWVDPKHAHLCKPHTSFGRWYAV